MRGGALGHHANYAIRTHRPAHSDMSTTDWLMDGTSGQCIQKELIAVKELLPKEGRVRADKRHRHRDARERIRE